MKTISSIISLIWLLFCTQFAMAIDTFDAKYVVKGVKGRQQNCAAFKDSAVWVRYGNFAECIRYFSSGLNKNGNNKLVAVWFSGDRLKSWIKKSGKNYKNKIGWYKDNSPAELERYAKGWSAISDTPYIWISRPGIYGSTGDHKLRRQPGNVGLVHAAVDKIKHKYNIEKYALMGQSGGGHLVASLLHTRNDIKCAVIGSGVVSIKDRNNIRGWRNDITGFKNYFDPIKFVNKIAPSNERRIFVVGDLRDTNVPFSTQRSYYKALRASGINAVLLTVKGQGKEFHNVGRQSGSVNRDCIKDTQLKGITNPPLINLLSPYDAQRILKSHGFDPGKIDGAFGSTSLNALNNLRSSRGLSVKQSLDNNSLLLLHQLDMGR